MKKLSEYKGEEAIDIMTEIMPLLAVLVTDAEIKDIWTTKSMAEGFKAMHRKYPEQYHELLVTYSRKPAEEFTTIDVARIINTIATDPVMLSFFVLPGQKPDEESSGSATENSEAGE